MRCLKYKNEWPHTKLCGTCPLLAHVPDVDAARYRYYLPLFAKYDKNTTLEVGFWYSRRR